MNLVEFNLPGKPYGELPDPQEPVIKIDGRALEHIKSIYVDATAANGTIVTITFKAHVVGKGHVEYSEEQLTSLMNWTTGNE